MTVKKKELSLKFQREFFGLKVNMNIFSLNSNIPEHYEELKERPIKKVSAFVFLGAFYNYDGLKICLLSHLTETENHSQAVLGTAVNISSIFYFFFFF